METALVARPIYTPPAIFGGAELVSEEEPWVWVVVLGFAYAAALAYATYCRHTGGNADISLTWTGFKVKCTSK